MYLSRRYNEGCQRIYDFNKEDGTQGADDFTQLLWNGTKKFGIGFAMVDNDGSKCSYVVARYRPTGNVVGEFRDNIAVARDKRNCVNPATVGLLATTESAVGVAENISVWEPKGQ